MNTIADNLHRVRERIEQAAHASGRDPSRIHLLAVSKTKPVEMLRQAWAAGQRAFGENYLQDALPKIAALDGLGIEWHYIGRIQSNKTREIASRFAWVHGLESFKHARRLDAQRPAGQPPLNCCIQVNLSGETSKGGIGPEALPELARQVAGLPNLRLRGLMTLPDPASPAERQRAIFETLARLRDTLNEQGLALDTLSMGMSRDLELAIAAGATLVRIGTDIFGPRD
jgi:pyridoxal phosphate enzyme (YggS family)